MEEYIAKRLRGRERVSSCRFQAPSTFDAVTLRKFSGVISRSVQSSRIPAAWTTPVNGRPVPSISASSAETACRSATSARRVRTSAPARTSSRIASSAAGDGARRPTRTRDRAPWATSHRAVRSPSPPNPPVTR